MRWISARAAFSFQLACANPTCRSGSYRGSLFAGMKQSLMMLVGELKRYGIVSVRPSHPLMRQGALGELLGQPSSQFHPVWCAIAQPLDLVCRDKIGRASCRERV